MSTPLRLLIVEDFEDDAVLLLRELRRSGYDPAHEQVDNAAAMKAALDAKPWDVVVSDYSMPNFSAPAALNVLQQSGFDLPFIIVSGAIGEDAAVAAMKAGAHDYVMKGNMARLAPAIARELREVQIRRERRQAEQAFRELYERTKKQAEELERANKVKDEFLSVMSHEMRTPLSVIMGYVTMIKEETLGEINAKQKEVLQRVLNQAVNQLGMFDGILQVTQMEADRVNVTIRETNLGMFLDDLRSGYEISVNKETDLQWDYPPDLPVIRTDGEKLKRVLQNLINNAVKFTPRGRITVSARVAEGASSGAKGDNGRLPAGDTETQNCSNRWIEFKVEDTGVGISAESLPIIFEKFRQADSSEKRLYGGVGIGLYIVKTFTELLGGKIEVETGEGRGSVFTVSIPCEAAPATVERGELRAPGMSDGLGGAADSSSTNRSQRVRFA
jgi:signal transduction histidine kinase